MTLLVGLALAEAFIDLHAGELKLLLTDRQARDAPQRFDIGDPVAQCPFDGLDKNRSRHPSAVPEESSSPPSKSCVPRPLCGWDDFFHDRRSGIHTVWQRLPSPAPSPRPGPFRVSAPDSCCR